jgi:hypothetical protein
MHDESRLRALLERLLSEEVGPAPSDEMWPELMARIQSGGTQEVGRAVYHYFQEVLPPHYHGGDFFAFAEGAEPLRLFARRKGGFVCRQLTWGETVSFCELAGIDLPD